MQRKGKAAISMGFVSSEMVNEELSSFVRKCFALTQELVQHWEGLWNQSWQLLCTPTHWAWPNSIIVSHWHFSLCEIKVESMKLPWRLVSKVLPTAYTSLSSAASVVRAWLPLLFLPSLGHFITGATSVHVRQIVSTTICLYALCGFPSQTVQYTHPKVTYVLLRDNTWYGSV